LSEVGKIKTTDCPVVFTFHLVLNIGNFDMEEKEINK